MIPIVDEIEGLTNVKGKWLRVRFRAGTPSAKKFKWLEFRLNRKVTEENKIGVKV